MKKEKGMTEGDNAKIISKFNKLIGDVSFSVYEIKALDKLISCIHNDDAAFKDYEINMSAFMEELGIGGKNNYDRIISAYERLFRKPIKITDNIKEVMCPVICTLFHDKSAGKLLINVEPYLLHYLQAVT